MTNAFLRSSYGSSLIKPLGRHENESKHGKTTWAKRQYTSLLPKYIQTSIKHHQKAIRPTQKNDLEDFLMDSRYQLIFSVHLLAKFLASQGGAEDVLLSSREECPVGVSERVL